MALEELGNFVNDNAKIPAVIRVDAWHAAIVDERFAAETNARNVDFCCDACRMNIHGLIEESLTEAESQLVQDHLAECPACEEVFLREIGSVIFDGMLDVHAQASK